MIHYLLIREDGSIMQRGACDQPTDIPVLPGIRSEVIAQSDTREPNKPPPPDYVQSRFMDYPAIGDQLDVLWKAIASTNIANNNSEVLAMLEKVQAVKTKHPK